MKKAQRVIPQATIPQVIKFDTLFDKGKWDEFVVGAGLEGLRLDSYYLGKATKNLTPQDCEKLFLNLLSDAVSVGAISFPNTYKLEGFTFKAVREKRGPYTKLDFVANFKGQRPAGGYFRTVSGCGCGDHFLSSGYTKHFIRNVTKGVVVALSNIAPLVLEYTGGTEEWYLNGVLHRDGGPAVQFSDGVNVWHHNGEVHRDGGPAYENAQGRQVWYRNNKRHREDGPAVVNADGTREWWLNEVEVDEQVIKDLLNKSTSLFSG